MNTNKKNKFSFKSEEEKLQYINSIVAFFDSERDEEIGIIAAEKILDFFIETMGQEIYSTAIRDSKDLIKKKVEDLEVELDIIATN